MDRYYRFPDRPFVLARRPDRPFGHLGRPSGPAHRLDRLAGRPVGLVELSPDRDSFELLFGP